MKESVVGETSSIHDAIAALERTQKLIVAVTKPDGILLGVITDGDIRRAILRGSGLDSLAKLAMSADPIIGRDHQSTDELNHIMMSRGVAALPVVDSDGRFVRVAQLGDVRVSSGARAEIGYWAAVVMAGGEGRRLRPLTANLPKPMIQVGGIPVLERQVRSLADAGIKRVFISTNYLAGMIEEHFGDGADFGIRIDYLREKTKLGTAGALSLLPERPQGPILVMNGDVLTTSDFTKLLAYHQTYMAPATMATITYKAEIPFGVVDVSDWFVTALTEKPTQVFQCNAGIYVLEPGCLARIPTEQQYHMTDLIHAMVADGEKVAVFPIHEHWADIGSPADLEGARRVFGGADSRTPKT